MKCKGALIVVKGCNRALKFYRDLFGLQLLQDNDGNMELTGILIFAAPILYCLCGLRFAGIILCAVAFVSACEELIITVKPKELDRDCKGILVR